MSCLCQLPLRAQSWTETVRGSWVREGETQNGDVTLYDGKTICDIEVRPEENSAVKQAATFLAGDIERLTGDKPAIVERAIVGHITIHLSTAPTENNGTWPWAFSAGAWEAYEIRASGSDVFCVGSDFRGTAFAAYTLCERLGIDPLYHWTGYQPKKRERLILQKATYSSAEPTVRYRGFFHDDEDILPRPFEPSGYPFRLGDVPTEWYAKYFETALRLRMNMVAPYTRVHRRYEVQKMASDWGLFYTSHHYDILLSNPFGITRYALAEKRHSGTNWNWE
ncbi:MAG: glycosyl hydrolase 115 family protein, partial [Verrucomicrobiota bacterium]